MYLQVTAVSIVETQVGKLQVDAVLFSLYRRLEIRVSPAFLSHV